MTSYRDRLAAVIDDYRHPEADDTDHYDRAAALLADIVARDDLTATRVVPAIDEAIAAATVEDPDVAVLLHRARAAAIGNAITTPRPVSAIERTS